jgi:hypothetical protein
LTSYAVDQNTHTLIRVWATGRGDRAAVVSKLPDAASAEELLNLAQALTSLSHALWRCYTHPASATDSLALNTEGWRRDQTREGFPDVVPAMRNPNLPDEDGFLDVCYDPVEEGAHRVGRAVHALHDADLVDVLCADVAAELEAVESAERGRLDGRAVQAVVLSRADASPVQVAAADTILRQNPLAGERLFWELEPTAASVAAAHWLKAAADVAAEVSGMPATDVLPAANGFESLRFETANDVVGLFDFSSTAYRIVAEMVSEAMLVAEGVVSDLGALLVQHDGDQDEGDDEAEPIRLTPLDPQRPARDLLEDLLIGIYGCRLIYAEYAVVVDDGVSIDDAFCTAVRGEAEANYTRLL